MGSSSTFPYGTPSRRGSLHGHGHSHSSSLSGDLASTLNRSIGARTPIGNDSRVAVNVSVRVRPDLDVVDASEGHSVENMTDHTITVNGRKYMFDQIFAPETTQESIYSYLNRCIPSLIQGYNVSIMAYGQSGSGKSYTMGTTTTYDARHDGILHRASRQLFQEIELIEPPPVVSVTYVEIYNEQLIDLLGTGPGEIVQGGGITAMYGTSEAGSFGSPNSPRGPIIREDVRGNIYVQGVKEEVVTSSAHLLRVLARGSLRRQTGSTAINVQSSRSHAICTIHLTQKQVHAETQIMTTLQSKLNFVDLAGSERLKNTKASDDGRLKEGISINSGLTALGKVITQLSTTHNAAAHISYRDSKLTRLLQDSLGGKAITYLIACVSNEKHYVGETTNTLSYAQRARSIQAAPEIQRVQSRDDMVNTIAQLQQEVQLWKSRAVGGANLLAPSSSTDFSFREEDTLSDGTLVEEGGAISPRGGSPSPSFHKPPSRLSVGSALNYREQMLKSIAFQENVDRLIDGYEKTIDTLQTSISVHKQEKDELNSKLVDFEKQTSVLQKNIAELRGYVEILEKQEGTKPRNNDENDSKKQSVEGNDTLLTTKLQKQVKALQAERDSLRVAQKMYHNEVQHLTMQYNRVVREVEGLRERVNDVGKTEGGKPDNNMENAIGQVEKEAKSIDSATTGDSNGGSHAHDELAGSPTTSTRRIRRSVGSFLAPAGAASREWLRLHSQ